MTALNKQALREMSERAASDSWGYDCDEFNDAITPEVVLVLLDELEAAEKRIAELDASHSKQREGMAAIYNAICENGASTSLSAILTFVKRSREESASAAGIGVKGE